eukprot:jgi/Mesen1/3775/ME000205S03039
MDDDDDALDTREGQIRAIEESFRAAQEAPVHPTNPSLTPVEILPVVPHIDRSFVPISAKLTVKKLKARQGGKNKDEADNHDDFPVPSKGTEDQGEDAGEAARDEQAPTPPRGAGRAGYGRQEERQYGDDDDEEREYRDDDASD